MIKTLLTILVILHLTTSIPVCMLPKDPGPCRAATTRFFANYTSGSCEKFIYGGCQGNANNFNTLLECNQACICSLPPSPGPCKTPIIKYYFNNETQKCENFSYGGCQGNGNNFGSIESCEASCLSTNDGCACPMMYDPVCGSDGKTYGNDCEAKCRKSKVLYKGSCDEADDDCICPMVYDAVCGEDGETYSNECQASCKSVKMLYKGECDKTDTDECVCPMIYEPVCGADGKTYENECQANCKKVKVLSKGSCDPETDCVCPMMYEPVCGDNGKTYSNECVATKCEKVKVAKMGACVKGDCDLCMSMWEPVCGKDGNTYENECRATCVGVTILIAGEC